MNEEVLKTYKSNDTEEWLDRVFTRPIGYLWARFFQRLGVHPNVVTVLSILIGISSAYFFAHGSFRTEGALGLLYNIIGVLLMMWANFYDSADGQLARMTNQKTQLGRILDGAASIIIFIPVYATIIWRFWQYHTLEFQWLGLPDTTTNALICTFVVFLMAAYSGLVCHSGQCRMADYYRQIHLYFLQGDAGSELHTSAQAKQRFVSLSWRRQPLEKFFQMTYVNYTRQQERKTPACQLLLGRVRSQYGGVAGVPQSFRDEFRRGSLPLMPYTNILTFNTRAIALYTCCLLDLPWLFFVFEIVVLSALCKHMRHRHEHLCRQLAPRL
ncbi:MAG: CDP-alcohol phosphatidyltransferase family protein [Bacteroidaceae bacterium]|nr:CDP-alcohol phosphatidyltransferase family protein [Bacteroidaceae bacterium]